MEITSDVILNPITEADKEAWLGLWAQYLIFYKADVSDAVTELSWQRLLDANEPMGCILARQGGNAVGFANHVQHRSTWTRGDYLYLEDLFVDPSARGQGVGGKLISALYTLAAQSGCSRVYWHTHQTNSTAMRLYDWVGERSGFVHYQKQLKTD
ncbi:GNAT superfamily N-acetyltransferase [Sphingobium sp. B11D3B]|uniref:GNAT family N-acetyltransferase n=1 Tax=Sphingobium sp. B11D3B TaxID=2940575 RepID=UPI002227435C|nr:GNAT family N-acetyltransferase [Sphingobium sp. B11D3B]MCW2389639.1 GNAT superfamily N-acetyltransferase [Sphingobium sp. B11D3B]